MAFSQDKFTTMLLAGAVIGPAIFSDTSSNGETEFMLRPSLFIKQRTAYLGNAKVMKYSSLSSQEIVAWLREEGIPIAAIAEAARVERKSVYAWLSGSAVKTHNQERLEKIYSLLNENKLTHLRHLYRFWSRDIIGKQSIASMMQANVLDEMSIRNALSQLWPLAKKEEMRESLIFTTSSTNSNSFLRESREVTTSYDS
jgi:hypothetical protein